VKNKEIPHKIQVYGEMDSDLLGSKVTHNNLKGPSQYNPSNLGCTHVESRVFSFQLVILKIWRFFFLNLQN
jgi:hypothetical protein